MKKTIRWLKDFDLKVATTDDMPWQRGTDVLRPPKFREVVAASFKAGNETTVVVVEQEHGRFIMKTEHGHFIDDRAKEGIDFEFNV